MHEQLKFPLELNENYVQDESKTEPHINTSFKIKEEAINQQKKKLQQPIYGSDLYGDALLDARANLDMAGFSDKSGRSV